MLSVKWSLECIYTMLCLTFHSELILFELLNHFQRNIFLHPVNRVLQSVESLAPLFQDTHLFASSTVSLENVFSFRFNRWKRSCSAMYFSMCVVVIRWKLLVANTKTKLYFNLLVFAVNIDFTCYICFFFAHFEFITENFYFSVFISETTRD